MGHFQMQQWAKETKRRTWIKSQVDGLENTAVGSHRFWPSKPNSITLSAALFYFRHWKAVIRCALSFFTSPSNAFLKTFQKVNISFRPFDYWFPRTLCSVPVSLHIPLILKIGNDWRRVNGSALEAVPPASLKHCWVPQCSKIHFILVTWAALCQAE